MEISRRCLIVMMIILNGCARGFLYTDVTTPLSRNFSHTPRGPHVGSTSTLQVRDPITNLRLSAEWNTRAIGDAAQEGKLGEIYYADLHTMSILGGIWQKKRVIVYGKRDE